MKTSASPGFVSSKESTPTSSILSRESSSSRSSRGERLVELFLTTTASVPYRVKRQPFEPHNLKHPETPTKGRAKGEEKSAGRETNPKNQISLDWESRKPSVRFNLYRTVLIDILGGEEEAINWLVNVKGLNKDTNVVEWDAHLDKDIKIIPKFLSKVFGIIGIELNNYGIFQNRITEERLDGLLSLWNPVN